MHKYYKMYGMFLLPLARGPPQQKKVKFLEIGMGCNMLYGPGKSVKLWSALFGRHGEIWMAEKDELCVKEQQQLGRLKGINVLVGSQNDPAVLQRWVKESKGNFDVIVDDGGHSNFDIWTSFNTLYAEALSPGGFYFIEDLHVGRFFDESDGPVVSDVIQTWIDQLLISDTFLSGMSKGDPGEYYVDKAIQLLKNPSETAKRAFNMRRAYPVPESVDWIFCQSEACVIAKKFHRTLLLVIESVLNRFSVNSRVITVYFKVFIASFEL